MTLVIFFKKRLISALYNVRYIPFSLIRLIFRLYNEIKGQSPECVYCFTIYFGPGRTVAGNERNHTRPENIRRRNNRRKHQREVAMFTHRNNEKDNERGALMIEAIALLGLMTLMSPMVVRQTADRLYITPSYGGDGGGSHCRPDERNQRSLKQLDRS